MTTQNKLIFSVTAGFCMILAATRFDRVAIHWRGLLIFSGGWLLAVGVLYQVKLYAREKDVRYHIMVVFAGLYWLGMIGITLFWLCMKAGVV